MGNQITEVRLLSVPLKNDYKHTLYFNGRGTQAQYFTGLSYPAYTYTDLSYQRKDKYIAIPRNYEDLQKFNYLMYRNRNQSYLDWKYAFITKMEYRSDDVTWVYFETDVLQTYLNDYTVKASFVEREHTNDDTVGKYTFPENLECGEFVSHYKQVDSTLTNINVVIGVSDYTASFKELYGDSLPFMGRYNGSISGIIYRGFVSTALNDMRAFIGEYDSEGKSDAIQCIFMAPSFLTPLAGAVNGKDWHGIVHSNTVSSFEISVGGGIVTAMDNGYTPRNKKLLTYPYKYLLVSNNAGASAIYHYEHFNNAQSGIKFKVYGVLTPGCSIRMVPMKYKGVDENNEEGLNLGKFPICNWTSDVYTNWLTQNAVNIGLNVASGVGQIVAGTAIALGSGGLGTAVGGGSVVGGVSTIANQLAQIHQMKMTPDQSRGNINSGDVTTCMNQNTFTIYGMSIKKEYAQIIDGFFDMFGYKVNMVKVPLSDHRPEYWYTKTIDVSIDGDIPKEDMQKIKDCYNRGVTFWKNPANVGDYSVTNTI